jgi:hypothetical protein
MVEVGLFFSCCHNYNKERFEFVFSLFIWDFSHGVVMKRSNNSLTKD